MIDCNNWLYAEYEGIPRQDANSKWYLLGDDNIDMVIDYCPFCGSKLDEKGCPKAREIK